MNTGFTALGTDCQRQEVVVFFRDLLDRPFILSETMDYASVIGQ